ncbi:pathogenesis-related protein PR-1 type-like [Rhododendron vialii]|uniref:pathogenesis-related protein PR-1 type-like n=1 Tax=Rhododendron vialii TaxID=182163 RepID=UPI00265FC53A|nr:pathogenesis-related protein PR-1 type-like [Rhododendron vialii]
MGSSDITSLALVCLAFLDSPQDYLNGHNSVRAAVGVGPLTWDDNIAALAQNYANQRMRDCALVYFRGEGKYSENLAIGNGEFTNTAIVGLWAAEKPNYDYNSNSCAAGQVCGHCTQMVSMNSVRHGCARVQCDNGWWFITCNYDPPGNYVGQRPY